MLRDQVEYEAAEALVVAAARAIAGDAARVGVDEVEGDVTQHELPLSTLELERLVFRGASRWAEQLGEECDER